MARRVLIIGSIHFVDENGCECDPQIDEESFAIDLREDEDPNEIGEKFLGKGHLSYTTLMGVDAQRYKGKTYTTDQLKEKWEVCTVFASGCVENVWHEEDGVLFFDSEEEAQAELDEHIEDCREAVEDGHMDEPYEYEDFVVRRVLG